MDSFKKQVDFQLVTSGTTRSGAPEFEPEARRYNRTPPPEAGQVEPEARRCNRTPGGHVIPEAIFSGVNGGETGAGEGLGRAYF